MRRQEAERYTTVAIVLHWLIALAILAMIPMGLWMADAIRDPAQQQAAYRAFQLHKSLGFAILVLTLVRLAWRLGHPVPALPTAMPGWERFAARATHAAFYALLLLLPLTGWAYVSSGWSVGDDQPLNVATSWFGLFTVPHLGFVAEQPAEARRAAAYSAMGAHEALAKGAAVLIVLHVGAALKHQFKDKDRVLAGMMPWLKTDEPGETTPHRGPLPLIVGAGAVVALMLAAGMTSSPSGNAPTPAPEAAVGPQASAESAIVPGTAAAWTVDKGASSIAFAGAHAGRAFKGRFDDWEAHIWFDPADLAGSKAVVVVRTGSARTGDATQEGSLTDPEWFDIKAFPTARFETSAFRDLGGGRYEAVGTLRIKNAATPVTLPFTLRIDGDKATVEGKTALDRTALDMGMASDPSARWVTRTIDLTVSVSATRAG